MLSSLCSVSWRDYSRLDLKENFEDNQAYYFKETSAPLGYELPKNPENHYFYYSPNECDAYDDYYKKVYGAVNLAKTSASIYVENKKIK